MENLFNWSQPARRRCSSRGKPVQSVHEKPAGIKPATKVVQIPVHSVSSVPDRSQKPDELAQAEAPDRTSASALRIQKVFRGYMVRKNVKRIMSIRKEVDEIERKLSFGETAELIRRDERERLRVNETLMSLLFKLDSIRGIDSGVRECRKGVIKKAISLQEKVDSIVSGS